MAAKKNRKAAKTKRQEEHRPASSGSFLDRICLPPVSFLIILAVIFACYYQTLSFDFTRLDDDVLVIDNLDFYQDFGNLSQSFARDAFNSTKYVFYRPVQNLSFFVDAHFSGASPTAYKITNLLLHFLALISLLWLLQCLGLDRRLSFLGVLIYAVHPLFNHAVVWIPARGDLFITLFGILAYIGFLKYYRTGKWRWFLLQAAALFLAVFSKETAILFPLLFGLHVLLFEKEVKPAGRGWIAGISSLSIVIAFLVCRSQVVTVSASAGEFGIAPLFYNLRTIPEFLAKFILPLRLSVMPLFTRFATIAGIALLGLIVWLVWNGVRKGQMLPLFGLAWFLTFTAVTMLYRHKMGQSAYDYLEHRAYLAMMGVLIALIASFQNRLKSVNIRLVFFSCLTVAVIFSAGTLLHSRDYQNPLTFYGSAIRSNPRCAVALYNQAKYRRSLGDMDGAMADYTEAIRVKPDCAEAYNNRGNAKNDRGDVRGAILDYDEAIRFDGQLASAYFNRGKAKMSVGDKQSALDDFTNAIRLDPAYFKALNNRGAIYYDFGQLDLAYNDFTMALLANPKFSEAWRNRGSVHFRRRDVNAACADWHAAAARGSKDAPMLIQQHCK
jgi:tetratricopeptide (TPR) repeat protein